MVVWMGLATAIVCAVSLAVGPDGFGWPAWNSGMMVVRAQRIATGLLVGAALAASGAVLQALLRNPLADPYILGVSGGAGLGAAMAIFFGITAVGLWALPVAAFLMAFITLLIVYALASRGGAISVYGLLLSGVIISALCSSLLMLLISRSSVEGLHTITWWMLGNLQAASSGLLKTGALFIGLGLVGSLLIARDLNALTLGRDMAWHLGIRPGVVVAFGLLLATLMTATAVALAGLIGFVGLLVPHAVRMLTGADHRRLLPGAVCCGGLFLVVCDTFARTLWVPEELPVGVVTALIGAPFFIVLLRRRRMRGWVE